MANLIINLAWLFGIFLDQIRRKYLFIDLGLPGNKMEWRRLQQSLKNLAGELFA